MNTITSAITDNIRGFEKIRAFQDWLQDKPTKKDDVIIINNSFVFREDVKTNKSSLYVALKFLGENSLNPTPYIVNVSGFNSDMKYVPAEHSGKLNLLNLDDEVDRQMQTLGDLLFILIGHVDHSIKIEEPLRYSNYDSVIWDSSMRPEAKITGRNILVKDTSDEEKIWAELETRLSLFPNEKKELRNKLGIALDRLQDKAVARLVLPTEVERDKNCITCQIVKVLKEQRREYNHALQHLKSTNGFSSDETLNEILRIAYNFASDATTFLRLIVSICDLKPIVLWGTLAEHYSLSQEFRELPWFRSRNKPSLKNYISIIGDARNSAFHNIFPFQKSLEVELPDTAFHQATLRFFSEFERRRENELKFQDKELVDVLFEFTRARTRIVPSKFWEQNLAVMDKTIALFDAVGNFLWQLL